MNNHSRSNITLILVLAIAIVACNQPSEITEQTRPNVILIMADEIGYDCLSSIGSTSYDTPILDGLAAKGIRFTKCISQPLCTPSRVKIMTGLYNYRNYEYFTYLNSDQRTFGNLMKEAGYATCVVGKWQLNGLVYELPGYQDNKRPYEMGFDEYCLWQLTKLKKEGERFANPLLEQNGKLLPRDEDAYGPDVVSDYAIDFIRRHKDEPFFIYFPMLLVHDPFVPTPDSDNWADKDSRYEADTSYFQDMMAYTDKIVGRFVDQLEALGIADNTLLIFTADNGTHIRIVSQTTDGPVKGAKGNTIDAGTHVPLIAYWPAQIKSGRVYDGLIEFSDFYPTLADIAGVSGEQTDGQSFYDLLVNQDYDDRETAFVHYDPRWSNRVNQYRNQFARTLRYKLYQDGRFFDLLTDKSEEKPLSDAALSEEVLQIKRKLQAEIDEAPDFPAESLPVE